MQLGMVGLGRMGANLVRRLLRAGHECVAFDMHPEPVQQLVAEGRRARGRSRSSSASSSGRGPCG